MNKKILIAVGILAIGAIGYGFYLQKKQNNAAPPIAPGSSDSTRSNSSNSIWDKISNIATAAGNLLKDDKDPVSEDLPAGQAPGKTYSEEEKQKLVNDWFRNRKG